MSFLAHLEERAAQAKAEFEAIDALSFERSFESCIEQARVLIRRHV